MGEMVAWMELENAGDREVVSQGLRDESTVRRAICRAFMSVSISW